MQLLAQTLADLGGVDLGTTTPAGDGHQQQGQGYDMAGGHWGSGGYHGNAGRGTLRSSQAQAI